MPNGLVIFLIVVFFTGIIFILYGIYSLLRKDSHIAERIRSYGDEDLITYIEVEDKTFVEKIRYFINNTLSIVKSDKVLLQLLTANWPITVIEYYLMITGGVIFSFILGYLISQNIIVGFGLAGLAALLPGILIKRAGQIRQLKFQNQLQDVLTMVAGSVKVGYSFLQSLDIVVKEMASPSSEEFGRVRREVELGIPLSQALTNLSERIQSNDLFLVITAININQQVGGNLATMIDAVTETIRERIRILGEVRVLTTYARYSSYILTLLPFGTAGLLMIINPSYMRGLFDPGLPRIILISALTGILIGNILIRRMSKIEV